MSYKTVFTVLMGLCLLSLNSQSHAQTLLASDAAAVYAPETRFSIFRKGKRIGTHTLLIEKNGDTINVSIDSNITVRVLKVPVFRFRYTSNERWTNNQLKQVSSVTTTRGNSESTLLINTDENSVLTSATGENITQAIIPFATNHWHAGALEQSILFNTIKGEASEITVTNKGTQSLEINGVKINTTQYEIRGQIQADVWYDERHHWIKLAFTGEDGSSITYLLDALP